MSADMRQIDPAPAHAEHRVVEASGFPTCGACRRRVGNPDVWRCPYRACRAWLRGLDDPETKGRRK